VFPHFIVLELIWERLIWMQRQWRSVDDLIAHSISGFVSVTS